MRIVSDKKPTIIVFGELAGALISLLDTLMTESLFHSTNDMHVQACWTIALLTSLHDEIPNLLENLIDLLIIEISHQFVIISTSATYADKNLQAMSTFEFDRELPKGVS